MCLCLYFHRNIKIILCCAMKYCIVSAERRDTSVICKKAIPQFKKVLTDFELLICWGKPKKI